ncbi:glucosyl-3-phosphoglycerate synthase [Candidatus Cryosericum terrychapinii]|uniref:Glucosyl-3-phosphoglycerate synthase n=1 Tax=Candidatus Cryosericum terrychapinii TaxID=2290919 RepID=A0A398D1P8_9BACT|nr:glucosyl-3-phosphoglycerate synthase [Candidatus Cryosericum terrychapinii]RIE06678.1 glucosyl-3-phosphoglycerate synthase [Candidatus Cryosericum terrychapinii]
MTQHFVELTAPTRLMAKVAFVRSAGVAGDVVLVLPRTPDEEIGRVHRLVAAARKALGATSVPFQIVEIDEANRLATSGDPSRTLVIDLDLLHHENVDLLESACSSSSQVIGYKLHQNPSRTAAIFARGDSNATLAGTVVRRLTEAGVVDRTSFVHVTHAGESAAVDDSVLEAYSKVKAELPQARLAIEQAEDGVESAIEHCSLQYGLLVLGLPQHPRKHSVTRHLLAQVTAGLLRVTAVFIYARGAEVDQLSATTKTIEPWILKNTFSQDEFADIDRLLQAKRDHHLSISLILPALNEEKTVGQVIDAFKGPLMEERPLLDEIILMDSDSGDNTREIATARDIPVYVHQQVRPDLGTYAGKGEAMWKALFVAKGDILVFVDTDLSNPNPSFVSGLVGPLLLDERLSFIKGFYRRPVRVVNEFVEVGGGRVTELTARPLLNLWYPELGGLFQPLAGTIAARAGILRELHFMTGYGVEIGHIIEYVRKYGIDGLAQSELGEIIHRNQPLEALSKMSFQVLEAFFQFSNGLMAPGMADRMNGVLRQPFLSDTGFTLYQARLGQEVRPPASSVPPLDPPALAHQRRNTKKST